MQVQFLGWADGHLGRFHVLPIINSAAMNTGVHLFQFWFPLVKILKTSGLMLSL